MLQSFRHHPRHLLSMGLDFSSAHPSVTLLSQSSASLISSLSGILIQLQIENFTCRQINPITPCHLIMFSSSIPVSGSLVREALADGMHDAQRAVTLTAPAVEAAIKATFYHSAFSISFGACFVGYAVSRLLPDRSIVNQGLRDGCEAAKVAVAEVFQRFPSNADSEDTALVPDKPATSKKGAAKKTKRGPSESAIRRARGEITATAMRITEDTSIAHQY